MIAPQDADDFKALLKRLSKGEKPPQRLNLKAQRTDGSTFDATMEFTEASYEGEPCQQITFRLQAVDPNLSQEIEAMRSKDLVTDLYNRQYLMAQLEEGASRAANGKTDQSLLLIEPDNFKPVLDTVGLGNADVLLGDMHGFTISLAQENAKFGITVNTVSPGYVGTDMVMAVPEDVRAKIVAQIPIGRLGEPDEIAYAVGFFANDQARWITGANLAINGGQYMGW